MSGAGAVILVVLFTVALPTSPASGGPPPARPENDYVLTAGAPPTVDDIDTLIVGDQNTYTPSQCRDKVVAGLTCDVYRIKLNLSHARGAENFFLAHVYYDATELPQVVVPSLNGPSTGASFTGIPGIDMYLYDAQGVMLPTQIVGGENLNSPERVAWHPDQSEYDVVVQANVGLVTRYTLALSLSDELFGKPFEFVDPTPPSARNGFDAFASAAAGASARAIPASDLSLALVRADTRIAGIGLGIQERFDAPFFVPARTRSVNVAAKPSTFLLLVALLTCPTVIGSVWFVLARRHRALI
ncbi:MAG: hypothetical protein QOF21_2758 [Actinomycetota bacterium]